MKSRRELQRELDDLRAERDAILEILCRADLTAEERVCTVVTVHAAHERGGSIELDDLANVIGLPVDVVGEALEWCSSRGEAK